MTDVFLVTVTNYPTIFKAFELISHDSGRQAGHENYAVPKSWLSVINEIERDLTNLLQDADSDFECLCTGDDEDRNRVVHGYRLTLADKLLQQFFEEFR
jgi:hypothetical protein